MGTLGDALTVTRYSVISMRGSVVWIYRDEHARYRSLHPQGMTTSTPPNATLVALKYRQYVVSLLRASRYVIIVTTIAQKQGYKSPTPTLPHTAKYNSKS